MVAQTLLANESQAARPCGSRQPGAMSQCSHHRNYCQALFFDLRGVAS